jgi:hypothetical protein
MTYADREEQKWVEDEIRRIARQLWPEAQYDGARVIDGLERDGVFETEDCIHLLEATVSRSKSKAQDDAKKLASLAKKLQPKNAQKAIKCWFVTKDEPTADQREVIGGYHGAVTALSFAQFQSKLVDATSYLSLRENYPFGSVRDPATGNAKAEIEYVPLDLVQSENQKLWSISEIKDGLLCGKRFVALGDYGAGKSMTLREVYRELRQVHRKGLTTKFPIYLNLRDHFGQTNAAEVLERHGRNLGFPNPHHLVRAWRAGYVILLVDGFDELTTVGIQGLWKRLQESRYRAMQVVREFVRNQPPDVGVVLAGRAHFFDSENERRIALGITFEFAELTLNEFSDEQIQRYLEKKGLRARVPSWMPSRPLLVGYLAASGILEAAIVELGRPDNQPLATDPARGWDLILNRVCAREAEIEAGIDGQTVRRVLERLATMARTSNLGLGPLSRDQVMAAFSDICGYAPDEKGLLLLQRLPGLGIDRADEGTRVFVDEELADACRAGDVIHFMSDPFGMSPHVFRGAEYGLGALGIGLSVIKAEESGLSSGKMSAVLRKAAESEDVPALVLDLARVAIEHGCAIEVALQLTDIYIPSLELNQGIRDCSRLRFRSCFFSRVAIDPEVDATHLPRFENCYVDELEGRSSCKDLPLGVFDASCEIVKFSEAPDTTNAISGMDLPLGAKVLLTVLKKIYLQSGSGRKENALQRGLDHHGRRLVTPVLRLLQTEGIVAPYKRGGLDMTIRVPDRSKTARVAKIITSPRTCNDILLDKASNLS